MKLLLAIVFITWVALAQETTGTFLGAIQDPSGAPIPRAKVTATDLGTQQARIAITDDAGSYTLPLLPIGSYQIVVEAAGFKRAIQADVALHVAESLRLNFRLELGTINESVEVSAAFSRVNTEEGSMSALLGAKDMQAIPVNGRNFNELLGLLPGTVSNIPTEPGVLAFNRAGASLGGTSPNHNNWSADGIYNIDTGGNGNMNDSIAIETVAEFRALRSNYDAQYGVAGGAQVDIITKSGGSKFHGHLEEFFRNDKMDTRNFFSTGVPPLRFNNTGFSVGGPVYMPKVYKRESSKTFFFASIMWQRISQGSTATATIPTPAMRAGNFGTKTIRDPATAAPFPGNVIPASRIDPFGAAYAALYPSPNLAAAGVNFVSNPWITSNLRQDLIRVDHQLSQKHQLMFRGSHDFYEYLQPGNALGFSTYRHSGLYTFGFTLNSTLSPTLQNQLVVGKTSGDLPTGAAKLYDPQQLGLNIPQLFADSPADYPAGILRVSGLRAHPPSFSATGYTGITFADDTNSPTTVWQVKDNLSKVAGKHLLKAGFLFHREWKAQAANYNLQGSFAFNGSYTGDGFADLLIGRAFTYAEVDKILVPNIIRHTIEAYFNDNWKLAPNFSLSLGVRFTHFGLPTEENGLFRAFVPSLYNPAKAPVVMPSGTLTVGTADLLNGLADPTNYQLDRQNGVSPRISFSWDPSRKGKIVVRGGYGRFFNRESLDAIGFRQMSSNPPLAQTVTVNQTLLSNPGGGVVLPRPSTISTPNMDVRPQYYQSWNLGLQRSVFSSAVLDVSYVGNRGTHLSRSDNINQPLPNVAVASGAVNVDTVRPYRGYGAITWTELAGNSIYHGLQSSLSQSYSRGVTLQVSYTFSKVLTDASAAQYPQNRGLERAPADFDVTHNFSGTFSWQMPFFKGQSGWKKQVLGGWQPSGIYSILTGRPVDVSLGRDVAGVGTTTQRPQIVCNPNLPGDQRTRARWFDTQCFVQPPTGTVATTSARPVRRPGVNNFNFSLTKRIGLTESTHLELQGDLYNAFNHTQFSAVGTTFGTATFGVISSAAPSREVQLGVKLRW